MRSYEQTSLNRAVRVTSSRVRREDRCSISSFLSRRPRWGNWVSSRHVHGPSCFLIFLLFDRAAGFLPPRPREAKAAGARRCGQGWPPLAATARLGLDGIEHDGTLTRSGPSSSGLGGCL